MAHPDKAVIVFGSDGSQQEGNDAEAARIAVGQRLAVKIVVDDNDVTIAGHPSQYLPGFNVARTLEGHGLAVDVGDGEDLDALYRRMAAAVRREGPVAVVNRRKMAVGIPGLEGSNQAQDVIQVVKAVEYLSARGHDAAVRFLQSIENYNTTVFAIGGQWTLVTEIGSRFRFGLTPVINVIGVIFVAITIACAVIWTLLRQRERRAGNR